MRGEMKRITWDTWVFLAVAALIVLCATVAFVVLMADLFCGKEPRLWAFCTLTFSGIATIPAVMLSCTASLWRRGE